MHLSMGRRARLIFDQLLELKDQRVFDQRNEKRKARRAQDFQGMPEKTEPVSNEDAASLSVDSIRDRLILFRKIPLRDSCKAPNVKQGRMQVLRECKGRSRQIDRSPLRRKSDGTCPVVDPFVTLSHA
ncbi:MAG: hypothetical protein R3C19_20405 [Planctomycetaceae bacterium]